MNRYSFTSDSPGYVDAASPEEALKKALEQKVLIINKKEIPVIHKLICSVSPSADGTGRYSAFARTESGETVATADAPSPDRALRSLGYESPTAHMHKAVYLPRFGKNYELTLEPAKTQAKPTQQTPA